MRLLVNHLPERILNIIRMAETDRLRQRLLLDCRRAAGPEVLVKLVFFGVSPASRNES